MDYTLNNSDRLQLEQMVKANDVEDKTSLIRSTKHSNKIRNDVALLEKLKNDNSDMYKNNFEKFDVLAVKECSFLFQNYTDIYNKVLKDEINTEILNKFLDALELIENGEVDQHEASVKVGAYLKELYVDSALKKAEKNDAKAGEENSDQEVNEIVEISWGEYKKIRS